MERYYKYLLAALLIGLFGIASIHFGQDMNWDLRNYHFYNAYAFLYHRMGWDIAPAMLQTYYNPFLDIINYALIVSFKPITTAFLLGAVSGLSAFLLYLTALLLLADRIPHPRLRHFYALLATLIGSTGCATFSQLGTTTNENKIALLILLSFYFLLKMLRDKKFSTKYSLASGFCIGLAVGFKLTAATYAIGFFAGLLCSCKLTRSQLALLGTFIFSATVAFFIADGYWLWKMYALFKNPLFPYYNAIFHSPYAAFTNFSQDVFKPKDWLHYLFLPFYLVKNNTLTLEASMRDYRLAFAYFFALLWLINYCFRRPALHTSSTARFFFISFLTSYVAWLIQFTIYRYAIPLEYFAGLAIIYVLLSLISSTRLQIVTSILVTSFILLTTGYPSWATRTTFGEHYFMASTPVLPSHSLVLLVYEPSAYMIPLFSSPSLIRFIGIDNNLTFPTKNNALQKMILEVIQEHSGPIFTLTSPQQNNRAVRDLAYYDLTQITSRCQIIKTNAQDHFTLCPTKSLS